MKVFTSKTELRKAILQYSFGTNNEKMSNNIGTWDTSQITDMSYLFTDIKQISVSPITLNWNTSNVTNMHSMFWGCKLDFILNFDTSNVTNMEYMFCDATNFNQPLHFDTRNVTNMAYMFFRATKFNQPLNFDTSNVTDMSSMFCHAFNFNQPLHFDTQNVTNMAYMFFRATKFIQPLYLICNNAQIDNIFYLSPLRGQDKNYLLSPNYYYKLVLFYMLNNINIELLLLCDEFEEFY